MPPHTSGYTLFSSFQFTLLPIPTPTPSSLLPPPSAYLDSAKHLDSEADSGPQGKATPGAAAAQLRQILAQQLHHEVVVVFEVAAVHLRTRA
jgi:hypothetical protein